MKNFILAILALSILSSCAGVQKKSKLANDNVYTLQTDMYPYAISRAEYYEQMAITYSQSEQSDKAIEYFRLSLLHNPKRVSPYLGLSDEYLKTDRRHLAVTELNQAYDLQPDNDVVLKKLGDLYLQSKVYSKAREIYEILLTKNSKYEEAKWALFYIYKLEHKYQNALETLAQMDVTNSNNYKIAYEKAMCYKLLKDDDGYFENLDLAYQLNPRDPDILLEYVEKSFAEKDFVSSTNALVGYSDTHEFNLSVSQELAYSAVQSEHYEVALREYNKQRPLSYDVAMIDLKKAHVYNLMADYKNAEKLYLSVLEQSESDEARYYLAQIYISQNKSEDAAFILSRMPTSSEYYGESQVRLAMYKKYQGLNDEAINILRMAFIQRPDQLVIYKSYADFLIESKRYVEAVALVEKGIKNYSRDEDLRLKLAFLHYRLNNQKGFRKQIFAALKINPQSANAYSMLAELWYLKNKSPDEVIYFVKKASEFNSTNKNIKPLLAWALLQQNNSTEAVAIFEEYFEENPNESFFVRSLSEVYRNSDIESKATKLSKLAERLEVNDSLKSRFLFRSQTLQVESEKFKEKPSRLPASLEN